jgi:hypothetical protein
MKSVNRKTHLLAIVSTLAITLSFCEMVLAVDDGARAYWKGRDGTNVVSFQYLNLDMQASDTKQFDPALFIYPNADASANIMIASYARHMTLFNRASSFSVNVAGGSADVDFDTGLTPPGFLPPGVSPGDLLHQSSSGYADPSAQLDVNLFGTPPLRSTVDLANYEPAFTLDAAVMLAFPLGKYDGDKIVNMGLNRWYGRLALPMKYHFGVFSPGRKMSFELTPSMWLFGENDDFVGQTLQNDSLWQLESHLTMDFTRTLYGSLDLLYRSGFKSEINGVDVGEKLDIGDIGFTLNYQATDNLSIRASYSSNVFGDNDLNTSIIRLQLVYGWHRLMENMKKLQGGSH